MEGRDEEGMKRTERERGYVRAVGGGGGVKRGVDMTRKTTTAAMKRA